MNTTFDPNANYYMLTIVNDGIHKVTGQTGTFYFDYEPFHGTQVEAQVGEGTQTVTKIPFSQIPVNATIATRSVSVHKDGQ